MQVENKIMADEIKNGITDGVAKRLSSPFYGYFLISWALWNWKLLYITFFISNESIVDQVGKLKIDYISDLFFAKTFPELFIIHITLPVLSVLFIVWIFSIFTFEIYKKDLENETEMKILKLKEEKRLLKEKGEKVEKEKKVTAAQREIERLKKEDEEEKNKPLLWEEEYEKFKKNSLFYKFEQIIKCLYDYGGRVKPWPSTERAVGADILAVAHTMDLIELKTIDRYEIIESTDKGKFFISKYLETHTI